MERSVGHLRPMWAWGCVERVAAGFLGGPLAAGGRWNTAVAVGVTAAAGLVLVAIVVSSRRSVGSRPASPHPLESLMLLPRPASTRASMQRRAQISVVAAAEEGATYGARVVRPVHTAGEASGRRSEASEESSERSKLRQLMNDAVMQVLKL